mgnify:CR=1 FL=1
MLIKELLTNTAKAGDIPFDIQFPDITSQDTRNPILKAGNTTPGLKRGPNQDPATSMGEIGRAHV